jgi:hypothetical protein
MVASHGARDVVPGDVVSDGFFGVEFVPFLVVQVFVDGGGGGGGGVVVVGFGVDDVIMIERSHGVHFLTCILSSSVSAADVNVVRLGG